MRKGRASFILTSGGGIEEEPLGIVRPQAGGA